MGAKRSLADEVHPSRRPNIDDRYTKRRKMNPHDDSTQTSSPQSVNALKEKVRDLSRLLDHSKTLPADVRVEKERALAGYRLELEKAQDEKRRAEIIKKYHMVRFFERQKATRALKKLQKKFAATPSSDAEYSMLQRAVREAEIDLNYTMYYPLAEKYQSLYPRKGDQAPVGEEQGQEIGGRGGRGLGAERPPLWFVVERATAEGTLETLRDGKGQSMAIRKQKPTALAQSSKSNPRAGEKAHDLGRGGGVKLSGGPVSDEDEDEDMSDGGFFE
ncbi:18S rRNA maturation protein [Lambiella insularis]|nr:18S rRNA maturation protein [Lambiella insularis]